MGRVKDYYWEEIEQAAEYQPEPDYPEYDVAPLEEQIAQVIKEWAIDRKLDPMDPEVVNQYWSEYLAIES